MYISLKLGLDEAFAAQDSFVAFLPKVELREIKRGTFFSISGYRGQYSCSFSDRDNKVRIYGAAGFTKDGSLARMSNGKLAIDVYVVTVNNHEETAATSIYNVPMFYSSRDSINTTINNNESYPKDENALPHIISLKEYVEDLRNDGLTMFHIEGNNVLVFTRHDNPTGGNADYQAEALFRQAKSAHVYDIKTVRIVKMPERRVIGRYVTK